MNALIVSLLTLLPQADFEFTGASRVRGRVIQVLEDGQFELQLSGSNGRAKEPRKITLTLLNVRFPRGDLQQPHSRMSHLWLKREIEGKAIVARIKAIDGVRYAIVSVGSRVINQVAVEDGYAWYYPNPTQSPTLAALEQAARQSKRGLWFDDDPVEPWATPAEIAASVAKYQAKNIDPVCCSFAPINRWLQISDAMLAGQDEKYRQAIRRLAKDKLSGIDWNRRFCIASQHAPTDYLLLVPVTNATQLLDAIGLSYTETDPGLFEWNSGLTLGAARNLGAARRISNYLIFCESVENARKLKIDPHSLLKAAGNQDDVSLIVPVSEPNINWLEVMLLPPGMSLPNLPLVNRLVENLDQIDKVSAGLKINISRKEVNAHIAAAAKPNSHLSKLLSSLPVKKRLGPSLTRDKKTYSIELASHNSLWPNDPMRALVAGNADEVKHMLEGQFPESSPERADLFLDIIRAACNSQQLEVGIAVSCVDRNAYDLPLGMVMFIHSDTPEVIDRATKKLLRLASVEPGRGAQVELQHAGFDIEGFLNVYDTGIVNPAKADFLIAQRGGDCVIARGPVILPELKNKLDQIGKHNQNSEILTAEFDCTSMLRDQRTNAPPTNFLSTTIKPIPNGLQLNAKSQRWLFELMGDYLSRIAGPFTLEF